MNLSLSKILLSGYYGFDNSGDDALLFAIADDLREQDMRVDITVLSQNPAKTTENYRLHAVRRMNPFSLLRELLRCDLLLSGGGTLIQDRTSTKSLLYYLTVIRLATLFGKKVMLYANGMGPLKPEHRKITRGVLNRVDCITLRDPASLLELNRIGVTKPAIKLTADPAFSLTPAPKERADELLRHVGLSPEKTTLCVSIRPWRDNPPDFASVMAHAVDRLCRERDMQCVFLPMQPQIDSALCEEVAAQMTAPAAVLPTNDIRETLAVIGSCRLCIGMRLHSLIYAVSRGVPVVGLDYDPKISGVMDYMKKKEVLPVSGLTENALCEKAAVLLDAGLGSNSDGSDDDILPTLREKAKSNAKIAVSLLKKA